MDDSVIQYIKSSAQKIAPKLSHTTPTVGCCSWLFRLFCPSGTQTSEGVSLIDSGFRANFSNLANKLNESNSSKHNCELLSNFLQNHPFNSHANQTERQLRNQVAVAYTHIDYFSTFNESDIEWCQDKSDSSLLEGLKSIIQTPQFIYHSRARSLIENLNEAGLLQSTINQGFIDYLTKLPKKDRPEKPLPNSFDSLSFVDNNFQHAQDLLRGLAASDNHHKYFAIANGLLQNMILIANDLRNEIDHQPGPSYTTVNSSY